VAKLSTIRRVKGRDNAHETEISEEREVLYHWHPRARCIVPIHEAVEKVDGTYRGQETVGIRMHQG
jgi:hypothetical protein